MPLNARLAAIAAVIAMAASGCGGAAAAGPAGADTAARAVPANALLYIDVNLDRGSPAWRNAEALGSRFPGWRPFLSRFQHELKGVSGGDRLSSVPPWLGNEAAIAVTGVNVTRPASPVDVALYASITNGRQAESWLLANHGIRAGSYDGFALVRSTRGQALAAVGRGALLVSNDAATLHQSIDAWSGHAARLSAQPAFTRSMSTLPASSLVRVYADLAQAGRLLSFAQVMAPPGSSAHGAAGIAQLSAELRRAGTLTGSLGADPGGLRLTMNIEPAPGQTLPAELTHPNGPPALIGDVPADAFAYLAGSARGPGMRAVLGNQAELRRFQQATGISITRDLLPLLSGGVVAYATPGLPPHAAVLLHPADPKAAAAAMTRLARALARHGHGLRLQTLHGGVGQVATVNGMRVEWHRVHGVIAISNDPAAGTARTPSLTQSASFAALLREAQVPAETGSLGYLDIHGLLAGIPAAARGTAHQLAPIGGLVVWSSTDAAGAHFGAFLQIRSR